MADISQPERIEPMTDESEIVLDHEPDMKRLMQAMETQDDIGALLRLHFELDKALNHVIKRLYPNPSALKPRYTGQKIKALSALGIPETRLNPARVINGVRNEFAHEGTDRLNENDVKSLRVAVSGSMAKPWSEDWLIIRNRGGCEQKTTYKSMSVKEQFCVLSIVAIGTISALAVHR